MRLSYQERKKLQLRNARDWWAENVEKQSQTERRVALLRELTDSQETAEPQR